MSPATLAHGELMAFLSSRAYEFKPGGLFVMAYIARSDREASTATAVNTAQHMLHRGASLTAAAGSGSAAALSITNAGSHSSPATPGVTAVPEVGSHESLTGNPGDTAAAFARPTVRERSTSSPAVPVAKKQDIWDVMSGILGKAIQRLVSTQLLKPAVARLLLSEFRQKCFQRPLLTVLRPVTALPIHPRSPKQTHAVLRAMSHAWSIEEEEILLLSHPAWKGLEHGTVSAASYADHTIQVSGCMYTNRGEAD